MSSSAAVGNKSRRRASVASTASGQKDSDTRAVVSVMKQSVCAVG